MLDIVFAGPWPELRGQGNPLRSGDPVGVEQEMWAQLTLNQALRAVMVQAAESQPGTDPDLCGFTTALQAARDLAVLAAGNATSADAGAIGTLGQRVLAGLLSPRRPRVSTRKVRSPPNGTTTDVPTAVAPSPASRSLSANPQISRPAAHPLP